MKKCTRIFSLLLALILALSVSVVPVLAATCSHPTFTQKSGWKVVSTGYTETQHRLASGTTMTCTECGYSTFVIDENPAYKWAQHVYTKLYIGTSIDSDGSNVDTYRYSCSCGYSYVGP